MEEEKEVKQKRKVSNLGNKYIGHLPEAKKILESIKIGDDIDETVCKVNRINKNQKIKIEMLKQELRKSQAMLTTRKGSDITRESSTDRDDGYLKVSHLKNKPHNFTISKMAKSIIN